jgi:DinB superfamily
VHRAGNLARHFLVRMVGGEVSSLGASHRFLTLSNTIVTDLRFPIGKFTPIANPDAAQRDAWIADIAATPAALRAAVAGLSPEQLDTPYRPGGWTVRQVVHHVPDSHVNAYVRVKLALTEDEPTVKPYEEARWAELPDARATPVETSLALLESLHGRWVTLLRAMTPDDFARRYRHPEHGRLVPLTEVLGLYAWHGKHHVAHITALRERSGW